MALDLKQVPNTPGIYKFFSKNKIIYIGKAKNLRKRVSSYFGKSFKDRKTQQIKILTDKIETFSTITEAEALLLEQSLIKENLPRFNILLRDDKTYPYVHFSMDQKYPSISMRRSKHAVSKNYFGPFISAQAVKATIKDLQKIYQIRNCSDATFKNRSRPCIEYQMQRCSAPCINLISEISYQGDITSAQQYLCSSGKKTKLLMTGQMQKLADEQEFERANEIKKRIRSLDLLHQEQSFNSSLISVDFFTCVSKLDSTGVCILSLRDGKIRGTKTHYLKGNQLLDIDSLFQSLIFSYYQNSFSLPKKIILNIKPKDLSIIKQAVKLKFGKKISISSNINQKTRKIAKLAKLNANQVIDNRLNRSDKYLFATKDLMSYLGTVKENLIIEGFDVSHHSGKDAVASAVTFSSNGPEKSKYRLFNIPQELSGNDVGSVKHVLERRINKENINPLPDIVLIDGGKLQLKAALSTFSNLIKDPPIILSIVKGSKRVRSTETILSKRGILEMPKDSSGFLLLQQIRDESHRFAIANNRKKKNKNLRQSKLDNIKGLGIKKKALLLKRFQSIKSIQAASLDELCSVAGISIKIAERIKQNLTL
ncbi:excinuclease ABC subunit UvrC [Pseudomonadota bacterium]|nr:excinuclease ABC subunit C [Euryarchaeota archaeon]MDC0181064.1 excinuclease ABC subunit UvrC [Pseudomonadota bacterium]|tara:strand:+ start:707 stop:2491 length:1785 start_codon:yes stop_codon:yes gene_type:complete